MSDKTQHRKKRVTSGTPDEILQQRMAKLVELQKGIQILKTRMAEGKKELLTYFEANPQLQVSNYMVDNHSIRYVNRKTFDGFTQKLVVTGLAQYFRDKGVTDIGGEVSHVMSLIKGQRQSKMVPNIEIRSPGEP